MSGKLSQIKWGTVLALGTSICAFATSAYNNMLIQSDRSVRETPYVIPAIINDGDSFSVELSNYSEVTARIKAIRIAGAGRQMVLSGDNASGLAEGRASEFGALVGHYFIERFGIDTSQELGVSLDYKYHSFMRVRQDVEFFRISGLKNLQSRLGDMPFDRYSADIASNLEIEVCSCNIYDNTCLIAGNVADIKPVKACPAS